MDYELDDPHAEAAYAAKQFRQRREPSAKSPPTRRPRAPAAIPPEQDPDLFLVKLWLDRESLDELRQCAHERGYGASAMSRQIVLKYLKTNKHKAAMKMRDMAAKQIRR